MTVNARILVPTFVTRRLKSPVGIGHTPAPSGNTIGPNSALNQTYIFAASMVTSLLVFWAPLHRLLNFAANSEFSYIPLIPPITAFVVVIRRDRIFSGAKPYPVLGTLIVVIGLSTSIVAIVLQALTSADRLWMPALSIVTTWWGLFIFSFGLQAARRASLPLCLLLFMIPAPERAAGVVIAFLQHESAVLSYFLFRMIGIPALREGMTISLPRLTIEVAPECSGIRSGISMLILTLAGANLYLRSRLNKILLVLLLVPLCVLKNAIRIVTLVTLALYVDPAFLSGPLHHRGGILFFFLVLTILAPIVIIMRRCERTG